MSTIPKELIREGEAEIRRYNGRPIFVGRLPDDFLRVAIPSSSASSPPQNGTPVLNRALSQVEQDQQLACSLQREFNHEARVRAYSEQFVAQIVVTVVDAKLTKNYGFMNMSSFVRFRVGHTILETQTATRAGREPKWNDTIRCMLPRNIDTIWIEIYQECMMTPDELIAEGSYKIPEELLLFSPSQQENTQEVTIPLSGKQGQEREGCLMVVFTFKDASSIDQSMPRQIPMLATMPMGPMPGTVPFFPPGHSITTTPYGIPAPVVLSQPLPPPPAPAPLPPAEPREEDIKSLQEMFPKIDPDLIQSMLVNNRCNLNDTITALIEINSTTQ